MRKSGIIKLNTHFIRSVIIQLSFGIAAVVAFWLVFVETFGKNMCNDISICYSIVVFLVGIIITLKIKILYGERKIVDLILFLIGTVVNIAFICVAYSLDCSSNENDAVLLLNGAIWFDFIITFKNICQVILIYGKEHFKIDYIILKVADAQGDNKDLFEQYLNKESVWIKRALTDKSFKNVNHGLKDTETNYELATYGDALIKLCYSEILLDNVKSLSAEKCKYESDKFFVEKVAKYYDILKYIKKDVNDEKMPNDYIYGDARKKNNPHKYIATAVEAMVGAIYKENKDFNQICSLLKYWMKL